MNSLVSIIVPCFNYAHFLTETINSVLNQTYRHWECIIVDDGSTDNTRSVAEYFMKQDRRFVYVFQKNKGLAAARNNGIEHSKGKYIQFLDADDLIAPPKIETQVKVLENNDQIGVCYCNYQTFDSKNGLTGRYSFLNLGSDPLHDFLFNWDQGLNIPIHSALFRKKLWHNNEQVFNETLKAKEDWLMWVKLALTKNEFYFINEDLAFYRQHEQIVRETKLKKYKSSWYILILGPIKKPLKVVYRFFMKNIRC